MIGPSTLQRFFTVLNDRDRAFIWGHRDARQLNVREARVLSYLRRRQRRKIASACFTDPTCTAVVISGERFERLASDSTVTAHDDGRVTLWL